MRALEKKLWRDAWHYRGQFAAIIAVVFSGMALFVSLRSMHGYLRHSRDSYYQDTRFAELFATVTRAPRSVAADLARLRGVKVAEPRIVHETRLDVPGLDEPATGRLISIPVPRAPMLNDLTLTLGRWPEAAHPDEVLVSQAFANANGLSPGDSLGAVLNGRWRRLHIIGVAVSPEYVYEVGSGSLFPDNRRFGAMWMGEEALAGAFGIRGMCNDLLITLVPGTFGPALIPVIDAKLARYGGRGAYPRSEQLSDQFLSGEIEETQVTSLLLPGIFLAVTTFLLHMVLVRLVGTQREQIATLKAFGYSSARVSLHFVGLALVPIGIGGLLGSAAGVWLAERLAMIYARYFQFPSVAFAADPWIIVQGFGVSVVAGVAGAFIAARHCALLAPAEAMRPESPARFRAGMLEKLGVHPGPQFSVIVRNLERRPVKVALSVLGLGMAAGLVIISLGMFDTVEFMKDLQFFEVDRADATVVFTTPLPQNSLHELRRLSGVMGAEGFRAVPVRLSTRRGSYRTSLLALEERGQLHRVVDLAVRRHRLPPIGIVLAEPLADTLGVTAGDRVQVEVLDGERRTVTVPVAGVVADLMGMSAYITLAAVPGLTGGGVGYSGAYLQLDPRQSAKSFFALKQQPSILGIAARGAALEGFEKTIAESFRISLMTTLLFACVIAFGIVYNTGRITLSERGRELASLRILGFTWREVGVMLLGEQAILLLFSFPVAVGFARFLAWLISVRFESTLFRLPVIISALSYFYGALVVLIAAGVSGLLLLRRLRNTDLVAVLKTRE